MALASLLLYSTFVKRLALFLTISSILMGSLSFGSSHSHILAYKTWKQKKIDEARSQVTSLKRELKRSNYAKTPDDDEDYENATRKLSQAELNLGVARELSANDYFVLYVAPQFKDSKDALLQAAKTLSPRDMADILSAYEKALRPAVDVLGAKNSNFATEPTPAL